jgi:DNA-binding beta-propeller fold protein YncE
MRITRSACLLMLLGTTAIAKPAIVKPEIAKPIKLVLPGGEGGIGFDDLMFSPSLHRVLAPAGRTGKLDLIDPKTQKIEAIAGFSAGADKFGGGHGEGTTSADAGGGFVFASDRSRAEVEIIDLKTAKIVGHVKLAGGPDYVRWVEPAGEVWVTEPGKKQIERFALGQGKLVPAGTIDVPGGPESLVIDLTRGRAYTHTWTDASVAIDLVKHTEFARWTNGCRASRGIALDEKRGLLFVGCDEGQATVLDVTHDGRQVGSAATGKGVDIIAYSPVLAHLYVPGGDSATLTILGVGPGGKLDVLGSIAVAADSHCVAADDAGHAYVCDPKQGALLVVTDPYPATR